MTKHTLSLDDGPLENYEKWSAKQLARDLEVELRIMENRRNTGDPLHASEMTVTISRDRYETLCRLSYHHIIRLLRNDT